MKSPVETVIDLMNEAPEQTETRRALAKAQRESFDNERDPDLEERRGGFRGASRRNDAWDMREGDYL